MPSASERLRNVAALSESPLRALGFELRPNPAVGSPTGAALDLEGRTFGGTISHWPPSTFEFLFIDFATGEVILLETGTFESDDQAAAFLMRAVESFAQKGRGE